MLYKEQCQGRYLLTLLTLAAHPPVYKAIGQSRVGTEKKGRRQQINQKGARGWRKNDNGHMCAKHFQSLQQIRKMPTKPPIWLVTLPWTQEKVINTRSSDHKENSEPQLQWNNPEGRRDVPDVATCVTQARKSLPLPLGRHIYTPPIPCLTVHYIFLWEN